jgi:hypothetical protein
VFHYIVKSRSEALISLLEKESTELVGLICGTENEVS